MARAEQLIGPVLVGAIVCLVLGSIGLGVVKQMKGHDAAVAAASPMVPLVGGRLVGNDGPAYFKDARTGLCFATFGVHGFTSVSCEPVEAAAKAVP